MNKISLQNGSSIEIVQSNNTVRSSRAYRDCSNCRKCTICTEEDMKLGMCFLYYSCWEEEDNE